MYYDETNSHPLKVDVFFVDVPSSTQPMELGDEEFFFFLNTFVLTKTFCLMLKVTISLSMRVMILLLKTS